MNDVSSEALCVWTFASLQTVFPQAIQELWKCDYGMTWWSGMPRLQGVPSWYLSMVRNGLLRFSLLAPWWCCMNRCSTLHLWWFITGGDNSNQQHLESQMPGARENRHFNPVAWSALPILVVFITIATLLVINKKKRRINILCFYRNNQVNTFDLQAAWCVCGGGRCCLTPSRFKCCLCSACVQFMWPFCVVWVSTCRPLTCSEAHLFMCENSVIQVVILVI